jgi:hypothetical protein
MQRNPVVCGGTAYWLFNGASNYYTLQVRAADTSHISLVKLSIRPHIDDILRPCLSIATDGTLSFFRLLPQPQGNQLEKWTCQNGDSSGEWICTVPTWVHTQNHMRVENLYVCERSNMLLFMDLGIHIADLQTGKTQNITEQFRGLVRSVCVPYEVDWVSFFSSRLEGGIN